MNKKNDHERRQFERLERTDVIQIKEFSYPERGQYEPAKIKDISGGGLQIETKRYFPEKTLLKIEINFSGWHRYSKTFLKHFGESSNRPLMVLAEVVRCNAVIIGARYEVALIFSGIDEGQRRALLRFIRDSLPKQY